MMRRISKKWILPILLPVQLLAMQLLSLFPEAVETYYSNGLYVWISRFSRLLFGWIPFSFGDVVYFVAITLIARWIYRSRGTISSRWKIHIRTILSTLSIFYFAFNLLWGINYHRVKLPEKLNLETEYTDAELLIFTKAVIEKTNQLHLQITSDKSKKVTIPYSRARIIEQNIMGYENLEKAYPFFGYDYPSNKKSLLSVPLTFMGFAGYLNPFTNESQVNDMLPLYTFPMTGAHEMAHQIGYASESEANFVGYLASVSNDDLYFKYSGYTTALRYCLGNWEARNPAIATQLIASVNPGIRKNFQESRNFWQRYESFIETGFHLFYDNFLKLNKQDEGMDSYSRFVDLLVNFHQIHPL